MNCQHIGIIVRFLQSVIDGLYFFTFQEEMVLTRLLVGVRRCPHVILQQCRRNIGVTAACYQQAVTDPIQKMFLDKVHDYASKSQ